MEARFLARELASRLAPVLPQSVRVSAEDGDVVFHHVAGGQQIQRLTPILEQPGNWQMSKRIEAAVTSCLQGAQDFVVDVTGENWPTHGSLNRQSSREHLLLVVVTVREQSIRMFFGENAQTPILELPPIRLDSAALSD